MRSTATFLVKMLRVHCDPNLVFTFAIPIAAAGAATDNYLLILPGSGKIARLHPVVEAAIGPIYQYSAMHQYCHMRQVKTFRSASKKGCRNFKNSRSCMTRERLREEESFEGAILKD
jgi:hypothetical protein